MGRLGSIGGARLIPALDIQRADFTAAQLELRVLDHKLDLDGAALRVRLNTDAVDFRGDGSAIVHFEIEFAANFEHADL